jgi:hypothetical protein
MRPTSSRRPRAADASLGERSRRPTAPASPTNASTGKRKNLGTFKTRQAAEKHERAVQDLVFSTGDPKT